MLAAVLMIGALYTGLFFFIYSYISSGYLYMSDTNIFAVLIPVYLGFIVAFTLIQEYHLRQHR